MKWRAVIFVEGKTDSGFISCYLSSVMGVPSVTIGPKKKQPMDLDSETAVIHELGGVGQNDGYLAGAEHTITTSLEKTDKGLFILDANDCIEARKREYAGGISKIIDGVNKGATVKTEADLFLMPNNQDSGELETMLKEMSVEKKVYCCIKQYKKCLKDAGLSDEMPNPKGEIYAYCGANQIKPGEIDYADDRYWDIKAECLNPLREFLTRHLINN